MVAVSRLKNLLQERERERVLVWKIEQLSLSLFSCSAATAFFSAEDDIEDSHALIACHAGFRCALVLLCKIRKRPISLYHHRRRRHDRRLFLYGRWWWECWLTCKLCVFLCAIHVPRFNIADMMILIFCYTCVLLHWHWHSARTKNFCIKKKVGEDSKKRRVDSWISRWRKVKQ